MKRRVICAADDLVEGGRGVRFTVDRHGVSEPAFVVRFRGQVHAYLNRCAHVPVEMDWQEGEFFDHSGLYLICATHGALYAPESGRCLGGRCDGKGLVALAVIENDGLVLLIEEGRDRVG
ncbi:MAG: Rieske 2Fe-2S domain-containing protein [Sulfuritalea sp.]|nr:Rieske 2Fe-2S domain-containing protein [Sulfuritalea sp.]